MGNRAAHLHQRFQGAATPSPRLGILKADINRTGQFGYAIWPPIRL